MLEDLSRDLVMMARIVQSQLVSAVTAFFQRDVDLARRVTEKDDHVDNLLGFIEEKCFQRIGGEAPDSLRFRRLRGLYRVAVDLEKLGDYAVNVAEQAVHVSRFSPRPLPFDLAGPTRVALAALDEVISSFTDMSGEKAKHACRCEAVLDEQYRQALQEAFRRLGLGGQDPAYVITNLFVAKFLERIGDSILNIGEATLFILTGERLKLHQYLHLEQMVGTVAPRAGPGPAFDLHQIWGGMSGARVAQISLDEGRQLIWKEGTEGKIEAEIREMREWNRLVPGLVPGIEARHRENGRESFLGQFLQGTSLRDVYLTRPWETKVRATRRLLETVRDVWAVTRREERPPIDYARQIQERLPELYALHPGLRSLRGGDTRIFGIAHRSLPELLERLARMEADLAPPVTVRLHGDFNTSNVVHDAARDRVYFIDVHRSGPGDYLHDVGVLLVSNLRIPLLDTHLVRDLERINRLVRDFAQAFARLVGDEHFEVRLALAQARSFITSGRVVLDAEFARTIFLQGVRMLERAVGAAA